METHILRFEHPEYLYWLLVIPVLIAIYVSIRIINKRQFKRFANDKFMEIPHTFGIKWKKQHKVHIVYDGCYSWHPRIREFTDRI